MKELKCSECGGKQLLVCYVDGTVKCIKHRVSKRPDLSPGSTIVTKK